MAPSFQYGQAYRDHHPRLSSLSVDQLATMLGNIVQKLDDPNWGGDAEERMRAVQAELARRELGRNASFVPMLACCGYNVRWRDWTAAQRRRLLLWMFDGELPTINDAWYMADWGEPGSLKRLRRLYRTIRDYDRKFGDQPNADVASARWQSDLQFLVQIASNRFPRTGPSQR